jgi:hypothetical protein
VALALPWLEAMTPKAARAQTGDAAKRFVGVYQPGGTTLESWLPTGSETAFTLSPILEPLQPVQHKLLVLSGLDMQSALGEQSQSGLIAFLTGTPQATAGGFAQGPSLDQVLAPLLSAGQQYPSLNMAVRWGTGKARGVAHPIDILAFADDASFTPVTPLIDPSAIWEDLVGAIDPTVATAAVAQRAQRRSVLDYLNRRYTSVAARLGSADRARLEQHLEGLRELEIRLAATGETVGCTAVDLVDTTGYDPFAGLQQTNSNDILTPETDALIPLVGTFMMDMLVMAMACDLTSVATLQWSDTEAAYSLPWLDLLEAHNYYQNNGGYRPLDITTICTWYSEMHAHLLQKMDAVDMGGHTLLDESVVFFGSEVQHPATHVKSDMPFMLAGGGGGLRGGRWLNYDGDSHNDLLVAILNLCGDERQTFGFPEYCTGPLSGLT